MHVVFIQSVCQEINQSVNQSIIYPRIHSVIHLVAISLHIHHVSKSACHSYHTASQRIICRLVITAVNTLRCTLNFDNNIDDRTKFFITYSIGIEKYANLIVINNDIISITRPHPVLSNNM